MQKSEAILTPEAFNKSLQQSMEFALKHYAKFLIPMTPIYRFMENILSSTPRKKVLNFLESISGPSTQSPIISGSVSGPPPEHPAKQGGEEEETIFEVVNPESEQQHIPPESSEGFKRFSSGMGRGAGRGIVIGGRQQQSHAEPSGSGKGKEISDPQKEEEEKKKAELETVLNEPVDLDAQKKEYEDLQRRKEENKESLKLIQEKYGEMTDEEIQALSEKNMKRLSLKGMRKKELRRMGFDQRTYFELEPRMSFRLDNSIDHQLDFPINPLAMYEPRFDMQDQEKNHLKIYNLRLRLFHAENKRPNNDQWSLQKITKVGNIIKPLTKSYDILNYRVEIIRGKDRKDFFSIADMPFMNPYDFFVLLNMLSAVHSYGDLQRDIRLFLQHYIFRIASTDLEIANALKLKKPPSADSSLEDSHLQKLPIGMIIFEPTWGVIFGGKKKQGKIPKYLFRMFEKERWTDDFLISIIDRARSCSKNSFDDKEDVREMIEWWLRVRKEIIQILPKVFRS